MGNDKASAEQAMASFRESLEDVVATIDVLSDFCKTTEELRDVCKLATTNDAQLRLLFDRLPKKK